MYDLLLRAGSPPCAALDTAAAEGTKKAPKAVRRARKDWEAEFGAANRRAAERLQERLALPPWLWATGNQTTTIQAHN